MTPAPAAGAARRRAPLGQVILLGALTAMPSISMDMYLPALPVISQRLHASAPAVQQTVTVFLLGIAVGQLAYGPLSDRLGRRPPMLIGTGVYLLANAACALAPSIHLLVAARLAQAVGACAGSVIARAYVRDRYEDAEVLQVLAMLSLVFGVAPVMAPLVGGLVLANANWRWIFGVQAALALIIGLLGYVMLPESRSEATRERARSEHPWISYWRLLRAPGLFDYMLVGSASGAALFAYIAAGSEVVVSWFHVPAPLFGWIFGANAIGLIGGGQINARLARRYATESLLAWALGAALASAFVLLACAFTGFGGLWGVLIPLFFVMSSLGFSQPNAQALVLAIDRERAGSTAALLGAVIFVIGGLAGVVTGLLHDGTPKPMAEVIAGSLVLSVLLLQRVKRLRRSRGRTA